MSISIPNRSLEWRASASSGGADAEVVQRGRAQLGDQSLQVANAAVDVLDRMLARLCRELRISSPTRGLQQHPQRSELLKGLVV